MQYIQYMNMHYILNFQNISKYRTGTILNWLKATIKISYLSKIKLSNQLLLLLSNGRGK